MNLLGIDFGSKHVGLSIATTSIAEPLKTISAHVAIKHIKQVIKSHSIDQVIIGLTDGSIGNQTKIFANDLKNQTKTPIIFQDETLTSQEAKAKLTHAKKKTRSGPDHHFAAALILQDYLDQQKS